MDKIAHQRERINPFKTAILSLLRQSRLPLSEFDIIQQLREQFAGDSLFDNESTLGLFQIHFFVMNALYQLQDELLEDGFYLNVSPLDISIHRLAAPETDSGELEHAADAKLKLYYLDWHHLEQTQQTDVDAMLTNFWQRYVENARCGNSDEVEIARKLLGVTGGDDWPTIQRRYRRLVAEHHPDRGGDAASFIALREAYEFLRCQKTYAS